jgi:hypothetical protein
MIWMLFRITPIMLCIRCIKCKSRGPAIFASASMPILQDELPCNRAAPKPLLMEAPIEARTSRPVVCTYSRIIVKLLHQAPWITLLVSNIDCYQEHRLTRRREFQLTARRERRQTARLTHRRERQLIATPPTHSLTRTPTNRPARTPTIDEKAD